MNAFQALRRLQAWRDGRPLPRGETLHFPVAEADEILVLAFLRMGGESSPWGIAWGTPGAKPEIRTVPEPRNREMVAEMVAGFAPTLLGHLFHPAHAGIAISGPDQERPLRQVWLPNASHVEMLHQLAYAYTFAKKGDPDRIVLLNAVGRAAGWLFREFNRPGQVAVMSASEALKSSFTFPCEDVRQGHLGYLLGWLETVGDRDARLVAATAAEQRSISSSLEPAIERDDLEPRIERYREARDNGGRSDELRAAAEISAVLHLELTHRFDRTVAAINRLRGDGRRRNVGVDKLIKTARVAHWYDYLRTERTVFYDPDKPIFVPSPETDRHPTTAADRYFAQQGCDETRMALLLDDDRELQAEALATGEAIHGTVRSVRIEATGRVKMPIWEVEVDGEAPTKLRKGKDVFVARLRSRKGRVRDIAIRKGRTVFTIEITALKTVPQVNVGGLVVPAGDQRLVGAVVVLLPATAEGIHDLKKRKLWEKRTPGAWLTDARPSSRKARLPAEVTGPLDLPPGGGGGDS